MTPLQAVRASNLTDNVMECIRHVVEKHDAALLEVAIELRKENEALRALLRGIRDADNGGAFAVAWHEDIDAFLAGAKP